MHSGAGLGAKLAIDFITVWSSAGTNVNIVKQLGMFGEAAVQQSATDYN